MQRRVIVTGGARGIGLACCERLARDGWTVIIGDLNVEGARAAAESLPRQGHSAYQLDITDETSIAAFFDAAEEQGPVTGLVCNAGILILRKDGSRTALKDMSAEEFRKSNDVNLTGTFLTLREFIRRRHAAPVENARIVTFASSAAQLGGYRSSAAYIASKSGVLGLTKAAAREAAPLGITVNAVAPGSIDAPMLRLSLKPGDEAAAAAQIPLGRLGTSEDVAGAVAFLCSVEASYLTGSVIDVNGGVRMQ